MQFLMALALRMGRTLGELRQTMTVGEFRMWAEYDRISPIGDIRGDILNARWYLRFTERRAVKSLLKTHRFSGAQKRTRQATAAIPLQGWKRRCWLRQHSQ